MLHRATSTWGRQGYRLRFSPASSSSRTVVTRCLSNPDKEIPRAAYIHLPFCKRKCFYCDFPVAAVGMDSTAGHVQGQMQQYIDTLCSEIGTAQKMGKQPLTTIYFGGGTPSLVPPRMVEQILAVVRDRFGIDPDAEVTLEADPGTFDHARLSQYVSMGVTRISMGVQSFQQENLKACGRAHDLDDVYRAIEAVRSSGVRSWSLDLISGLPDLTMASWQHSLQEAIKAAPDHISVYDLQVEEGTPFARWFEKGRLSFPDDDAAAEMYTEAVRQLTAAGYEHYEVSNYARPGHRSRHNQVYWQGIPYYAFGMGAASFLRGVRLSRPAKMQPYLDWVQVQAAAAASMPTAEAGPVHDVPPMSLEDAILDTVMLRLRTADGLDMALFSTTYGAEAAAAVRSALQRHVHAELVQELPRLPPGVADSSTGQESLGTPDLVQQHSQEPAARNDSFKTPEAWNYRMRLSDPAGFLLSNSIISDVFAGFSFPKSSTK